MYNDFKGVVQLLDEMPKLIDKVFWSGFRRGWLVCSVAFFTILLCVRACHGITLRVGETRAFPLRYDGESTPIDDAYSQWGSGGSGRIVRISVDYSEPSEFYLVGANVGAAWVWFCREDTRLGPGFGTCDYEYVRVVPAESPAIVPGEE